MEESKKSDESKPTSSKRNTLFPEVNATNNDDAKNNNNHPLRQIYRGRKYYWQNKSNLHIHILEHVSFNVIEIVAFNTQTCTEAEHIFVSMDLIKEKCGDINFIDKFHLIFLEYEKMKLSPPDQHFIIEGLRKYTIATYLLDRITVNLKPFFSIDLKDAVVTESNSATNNNNNAKSISLSKPKQLQRVQIKRYGKSTTLVGDIPGFKVNKSELILEKIITNIQSYTSATTATSSTGSKVRKDGMKPVPIALAMDAPSMDYDNIVDDTAVYWKNGMLMKVDYRKITTQMVTSMAKGYQKLRHEIELFHEIFSYLSVHDLIIYQSVSKKWHNMLSYHLKHLSVAWVTSHDYFRHYSQLVDYPVDQYRNILAAPTAPTAATNRSRNAMWSRNKGVTSRGLRSASSDGTKRARSNQNNVSRNGSELTDNGALDLSWWFDHDDRDVLGNQGIIAKRIHEYCDKPQRLPLIYVPSTPSTAASSRAVTATNSVIMNSDQSSASSQPCYQFLSSATVNYILSKCVGTIIDLRLHCVTLDYTFFHEILPKLEQSETLRKISLGKIRIDDQSFLDAAAAATEAAKQLKQQVVESNNNNNNKATIFASPAKKGNELNTRKTMMSPIPSPPSMKSNSNATNGRRNRTYSVSSAPSSVAVVTTTVTIAEEETKEDSSPETPILVNGSRFHLINGKDVFRIIQAIGQTITSLEVSITIGSLPTNFFSYLPRLVTFLGKDTILSPVMQSSYHSIDSAIPLPQYQARIQGISLPELLVYMSDTIHEALMLLDKAGRIITINPVLEKLLGYSAFQLHGRKLDFLVGKFTDMVAFGKLNEGILTQLQHESATTIVYREDGLPLLVQMNLLVNITKFRGLPLEVTCLSQEFLSQLAFEQEEYQAANNHNNNNHGMLPQHRPGGLMAVAAAGKSRYHNNNNNNNGPNGFNSLKRDWRISNKELSFHLIRFGIVSEPFLTYPNVMPSTTTTTTTTTTITQQQ